MLCIDRAPSEKVCIDFFAVFEEDDADARHLRSLFSDHGGELLVELFLCLWRKHRTVFFRRAGSTGFRLRGIGSRRMMT